ncbi:MAG: hypothetical protein WCW16_01825 [Candidatus Magasanikbacteria bacterium]
MPVSKLKKSTTKRGPKKKNQKTKAIEEAVKNIPSMIMNETYNRSKAEATTVIYPDTAQETRRIPNPTEKRAVAPIYEPPKGSHAWLWTGVVVFVAVILTMWILNMGTLFYQSKQDQDPAERIIETSRQDLRSIMETLGQKEKNNIPVTTTTSEINLDEIEKMLEKTVNELPRATTSTSSTEYGRNSVHREL